jgi:sugar lactone lactonase YvrE
MIYKVKLFWKHVFVAFLFGIIVSAQTTVNTLSIEDSTGLRNGKIENALFNKPFGMCIDDNENIYLTDTENNCIRKIDLERNVTIFAGSGKEGTIDGIVSEAEFYQPTGICTDNKGNFYIAGFMSQTIRKINSEGIVSTMAGSGETGYADGKGKEVLFNYPRGIVVNSKDEIFISDSWNHRIRKISHDGTVSDFAGGGRCTVVDEEDFGNFKDGPDTTARFHTPCGLSIDKQDNIYVADALNHRIRKITPDGMVSTIAGNGEIGLTEGDALNSSLNTPTEVYAASNGEIYFSDTYNNVIRKITSDGRLITVSGTGEAGYKDGNTLKALLNYPRGIVTNVSVTIIIFVDYNNNRVREIILNPN